jgi:Tfp pilus assembly protein PilN
MPFQIPISKDLRKLLAFGSGVGIEIGATDLEVAAVRVRPTRIRVLGRVTIHNFAGRPAAEWGAEYARFLKSLGAGRMSATVLLPRREAIVRQLALPGVARKDIEGAIRLQLDSLHPYGEDEVSWGWSRLAYGAVLVGIVRRDTVEQYVQLFTEAGVAVCSFTFSAAAVHAAIRLNGAGPKGLLGDGFIALSRSASGAVEVYGESAAHPVFSAEFELAPERAAGLALAELRLPPETAPRTLEEVLPTPDINPVENDLSRNALPYATALAGACPRLAPAANVLPPEHRRLSSRAVFIPTLVLAALVLLVAGAVLVYSKLAERRYLRGIDAEIAQLEPLARRAAALDRNIDGVRARTQLLDRLRSQTRGDLDVLNELTRLVEPPAWTNSIDVARDSVRVMGEAPQSALLPKILDSSPLFENSALDMVNRGATGELFQIHTARRSSR